MSPLKEAIIEMLTQKHFITAIELQLILSQHAKGQIWTDVIPGLIISGFLVEMSYSSPYNMHRDKLLYFPGNTTFKIPPQ